MTSNYPVSDGMVFAIILLSVVVLFLVIVEIRELIFYKRNNWDFDSDSNVGFKMYDGDSTSEEDLTSNRTRVCYGTPFMILGFSILLASFAAIHLSM
ncbi:MULTISPECIES: hypothetical protein [unclassified Rhizobium]|uniref:hypothetical protein n=1 Tax=unclassified Rhizobium TaxID=2613769 RepID=UPI000BE833A7|nr:MULTISPECIES: hypothetical protein [unclassified Rhizobium]MDF0664022.1 hypothetical protein [Rhizobium sp. BC49]PDS78987.1 hypothetical protein CO654_32300 [Rhizobium sp. L18]